MKKITPKYLKEKTVKRLMSLSPKREKEQKIKSPTSSKKSKFNQPVDLSSLSLEEQRDEIFDSFPGERLATVVGKPDNNDFMPKRAKT